MKGKKDSQKKKKGLIVALFIAVFLMAVGYAVYSTDLTINSVGKIYSDWDIRFSDASCAITSSFGQASLKNDNQPFCSAGGVGAALITGADQLAKYDAGIVDLGDGKGGIVLNLYTEFFAPEDVTIFTVDITNYSAMWDAKLLTITNPANDYIKYEIFKTNTAGVLSNPLAVNDIVSHDTGTLGANVQTLYIRASWDPAKLGAPDATISKPTETPASSGTEKESYVEDAEILLVFEALKP